MATPDRRPVHTPDEFSAFLSDIAATVEEIVETAPWRKRLAEAILRWEGEGIRTRRLEAALDADTAPDVDAILDSFAADVEALRGIRRELETIRSDSARSPVLSDPDRVGEAEALLVSARAAAERKAEEAAKAQPQVDRWYFNAEKAAPGTGWRWTTGWWRSWPDMAIKGNLKEASLPDVLQLLAMGQKTGCLSLSDRSNFGYIFFDRGRITYASIVNRRDRLGDLLVKNGLIQPGSWPAPSTTRRATPARAVWARSSSAAAPSPASSWSSTSASRSRRPSTTSSPGRRAPSTSRPSSAPRRGPCSSPSTPRTCSSRARGASTSGA